MLRGLGRCPAQHLACLETFLTPLRAVTTPLDGERKLRRRVSCRPSPRPPGDQGLPVGLASSPPRPGAHQKGLQSKSLYSPEDRRHSFLPDGRSSPHRSNRATLGVLA